MTLRPNTRGWVAGLAGLLVLALVAGTESGGQEPKPAKKPGKAAVERARKTVQMLDDIYKKTIVLITDVYVKEENDYPAGRAAIKLFNAINEKQFHNVKLLDVSGQPYSDKNVASDAFEKEAVQKLKAGEKYVERVTEKDGKPYLRAMTYIPVVMERCTLCHPNYKDAKKDEAIGALSYSVPIE